MSAPIEPTDTVSQKITKLLPADITAAALAIKTTVPQTHLQENWIVYGGAIIAMLAPFYFWLVVETKNPFHILFLILTYCIFFMSIAPIELGNFFPSWRGEIDGLNVIMTPIWVFLVTPIVAKALGKQLVS